MVGYDKTIGNKYATICLKQHETIWDNVIPYEICNNMDQYDTTQYEGNEIRQNETIWNNVILYA